MAKPVMIAQSPRSVVEIEVSGTTLLLRPRGDINEDLNFGKVFHDLTDVLGKAKLVMIDFGYLGKINSCGIREWLLFLEKVQAKAPIHFSLVNETAVSQAAVVPSLLGKPGTPVSSFEVPYFCGHCRVRDVKVCTLDLVKDGKGKFAAPPVQCARCRAQMEFDGLESEYNDFLKHVAPRKS